MTWFKVDDGFWSHPKTAALSDAAVTLWVRAGAYSCQHLTDGFVKRAAIRLLGDIAAVDELVDAGLWLDAEGGWTFHDWDEYQETSDVVKKRREDARERQRKAREAREKKRSESQRESRVTDGVTDGVTSQEVFNPRPDPTRPDPTYSTPNGVERVPPPPEPPADDYEPTEIETAARPTKPAKASSSELSFIRLHIGQQLPRDVEAKLVTEVRKLRKFDRPVIESALKVWAGRDAHPNLLPYLVTDELKRQKQPLGIAAQGTSKADIWTTSVIDPAEQAAATEQRKLA